METESIMRKIHHKRQEITGPEKDCLRLFPNIDPSWPRCKSQQIGGSKCSMGAIFYPLITVKEWDTSNCPAEVVDENKYF